MKRLENGRFELTEEDGFETFRGYAEDKVKNL